MRTVQDIIFNVTDQSLVFDAPEGRPSSVTSVTVHAWNEGDDEATQFTPTGTVEANPNTTLAGVAGPSQSDPRNVPLTATTGVETERTYLITSAASLKEWVEVESVASAASVTVRHPLHNDYASGAAFVSTRITAPVDATWVADETNIDDSAGPNPMYRVRWVYVVDSVTYVADTYCNLTRYTARHGVLPQDVEAALPGWLDALPIDHRNDQGRRLIEEAYRAVKLDLHGVNFDDASIAEAEVVDDLVRHRVIERGEWARMLTTQGDLTRYELAMRAYQERLDSLIRLTMKVPVRDGDGAGRKTTATRLSVR